jgi:hypothetical protein
VLQEHPVPQVKAFLEILVRLAQQESQELQDRQEYQESQVILE